MNWLRCLCEAQTDLRPAFIKREPTALERKAWTAIRELLWDAGIRDSGPPPDESGEWRDAQLPEDAAIAEAFPANSGRHDLYAEAMRLVGAKHSKGALVMLVNWLLHRSAPNEWHQLPGELPEPRRCVIVWNPSNQCEFMATISESGIWKEWGFHGGGRLAFVPTHWRYTPEPPPNRSKVGP